MNIHALTRLFSISILACAALFLAACGQSQEEKDTGPNANLSNEELIQTAIANMKAAKSYHFEFKSNGLSSDGFKLSPNLTIIGDLQFNGKGSKIKFSDQPVTPDPNPDSVDLRLGGSVDMIYANEATNEPWPYLSYDGGKTWHHYGVDTGAGLLLAMFGWVWKPSEGASSLTIGEQMFQNTTFKAGSPPLEQVDSVITRQLIADVPKNDEQNGFPKIAMEEAKRITVWVSTDVTPTIRQMRIEGSNGSRASEDEQPTDTPFTLTWTWSRFNEDFGEIKAPPTETIKSP